jgi:hypothetical protein
LREALDEAMFFRESRNAELRFRHTAGHWLSFESAATCVTSDRGDIVHLAEAARTGAWRGNTRWKVPIISL